MTQLPPPLNLHDERRNLCWRSQGHGPPVLLIHGSAPPVWGTLPGQIASFARVIEYGRRGFSGSTGEQVRSLREHADDAAWLLESLQATPAVIVGWSIGGVIALDLALRHPQKVSALVLLEPPLHAKKHPSPTLLNGVVLSILWGAMAGAARGGTRFSRWVFQETDGRNALDRLAEGDKAAFAADAAAVGHEIRLGTGEELTPASLAQVAQPTVVLVGGRSRKFLREGGHRAAKAVANGRLQTMDGAGHFLQLEAAAPIAATVRELLNSANH
ncbi:MAG: alpha/beta hydrolase [Ramlibacter sp.]|nr:alpha/beta hydrolase [Ramlibacter sp.]